MRFLNNERIVMSITPSNRGEGWELLRLDDHAAVNFLKVADHPEIRFVHANGFLAKTHTRLPLSQVISLAALAIDDTDNKSES